MQRHQLLLKVEARLVPVDQARLHHERHQQRHLLAVADQHGGLQHAHVRVAPVAVQTGAHVVAPATKVHLSGVPGVVHVEEGVQVGGGADAVVSDGVERRHASPEEVVGDGAAQQSPQVVSLQTDEEAGSGGQHRVVHDQAVQPHQQRRLQQAAAAVARPTQIRSSILHTARPTTRTQRVCALKLGRARQRSHRMHDLTCGMNVPLHLYVSLMRQFVVQTH